MAKAPKLASVHENFALPEFELPLIYPETSEATTISSRDFQGNYSVLFLYPKDDTSGCTQESLDFSNLKIEFDTIGVKIYGVSKDSPKKHGNFIKKYSLSVPLIADEDTQLISALGAWQEKSLYGRKYMGTDRSTFVINSDNVIIMTWRKVKIGGHAQAVLDFVKSLNR